MVRKRQIKSTANFAALFIWRELALLCFKNLLAIVRAAVAANTVSKIVLAALGALNDARSLELPNAGTSFVSASLRGLSLRYCHFCILLRLLDLRIATRY